MLHPMELTKCREGVLRNPGLNHILRTFLFQKKLDFISRIKNFLIIVFHIFLILSIVGDSLSSDILGGKNAGLTTIWYQRDRNITDHGAIHPDYRIFELSELPDLLKKLK